MSLFLFMYLFYFICLVLHPKKTWLNNVRRTPPPELKKGHASSVHPEEFWWDMRLSGSIASLSLSLFLVLPHSLTWHRARGLRLSFSSPTSSTFLQSQPEQASSRAVYASGPTLSIWSVSLSYVHKHTLILSVETNMIINNTSYSYRINMPTHTSTRVRVQTGLHAAYEFSDS